MANLLDEVLKEYVTPLLAAAGFVKKGRTYRLRNDRNDYAIVHVATSSRIGDAQGFRIMWGISPEPSRRIRAFGFGVDFDPSAVPDWGESQLEMPIPAPEGSLMGEVAPLHFDDLFGLTPERRASIGEVLAAIVRDQIVPGAARLLDRQVLAEHILEYRDSEVLRSHSRPAAKALILLDDAPTSEILELVEQAESEGARPVLTDWIRAQVAARGA